MSERIKTVDMSDLDVVLDCYRKLDTAYKRLRAENEKLREELNCWNEAANWPEKSPQALRAENEKLRAAFRVNMLRAFPHMSHDEIDAEIAAAIRDTDAH